MMAAKGFAFDDPKDLRSRVVVATAQYLLRNGSEMLINGINPTKIAQAVGVQRESVYRSAKRTSTDGRGGKEALLRSVAAAYLDPHRTDRTARLANETLDALQDSVLHPSQAADVVLRLANEYFADVEDGEIHDVQLVLSAAGLSDADIREQFVALYSEVESQVTLLFEGLLAQWRRKVRPPLTTRLLAVTAMALTEGLVVRNRVDRDDDRSSLLGMVMAALYLSATQPVDEPTRPLLESFREAIGQDDYLETNRPVGAGAVVAAAAAALPAVIDSGRSLQGLTLAEVAAHADLEVAALAAVVGDISGLGAAAVIDFAPTLYLGCEGARSCCERLVGFVDHHAALVRVLMMACYEPSPAPVVDEALRALTLAPLEFAIREGDGDPNSLPAIERREIGILMITRVLAQGEPEDLLLIVAGATASAGGHGSDAAVTSRQRGL